MEVILLRRGLSRRSHPSRMVAARQAGWDVPRDLAAAAGRASIAPALHLVADGEILRLGRTGLYGGTHARCSGVP